MLSTTTAGKSETEGDASLSSGRAGNFEPAIEFASELAERYELAALAPLLASCRTAVSRDEVSVAVVGRFKAGKSSFLNHFTNRSILPVGVVPVTAVVTEIGFGASEKAVVHFLDGRVQELNVDSIASYVSERENPQNAKGVKLISVELPVLERFRGLKFVDTPGLESALLHNTEESLKWLPNVGLALVAVSVDPPLSQQDIELLKRLYRFTPNVTVLLTKVDLIAPIERSEVIAFIDEQLRKAFDPAPAVVQYSVRQGYEDLRASLETGVLQPVLRRFGHQRAAIVRRKIETLLEECSDYVTVRLKAAESAETDRNGLKAQVIGQQQVIDDVKSQIQLIVRHAAGGTRAFLEELFSKYEKPIDARLLDGVEREFPAWARSLGAMMNGFDEWLGSSLTENLANASEAERNRLSEPLQRTSKQVFRILQDFRDRLSAGTLRVFGVPLRTTEVEIEVRQPETPDVRVGRIFDRSWELLSPVVPVFLIRGLVRRHFERQVSYRVFTNISRLVSQWEERINAALFELEHEAERRLDEVVNTVAKLIETSGGARLPEIRRDLEQIESFKKAIGEDRTSL